MTTELIIGDKIIMADGSPCDEESISWWYLDDEQGNTIDKDLAYVMDFTKHFPYWEELLAPEGYNHAVEIDGVWHWAVKENRSMTYPFFIDKNETHP
jgi:hypothetical protein